MFSQSRKKLLSLSLVLIILAGIFVFAAPAAARATTGGTINRPAAAGAASPGWRTTSGIGGTLLTLITAAAIARILGSTLVIITSSLLDNAVKWNTVNLFSDEFLTGAPVSIFWGYSRDIANSFLILILLWIAFGVIFNLERINARKLLVRVILVGLLINFSLTLTATVFGFANALAMPFYRRMEEASGTTVLANGTVISNGISRKIVEITQIHTSFNAAGEQARLIQNYADGTAAPPQENTAQGTNPVGDLILGPSNEGELAQNIIPQAVPPENGFILPGTKESRAVLPAVLAPAAWGVAKLVGGVVASDLISEYFSKFALGSINEGALGKLSNQTVAMILNPLVATLLLFVTAFILGSLAILFIARGIVIIVLSILSPLAFLAAVIPGQEKYWKMWTGKLINWSFFAPISFFLLLFAIHIGDKLQEINRRSGTAEVEIQANLPAMFQLLLIFGLLIGSVYVAKKMGIELAGTLMSYGEGFAKRRLTGLRRMGMGALRKLTLPTLGKVAGGLEESAGRLPVTLQRILNFPLAGMRVLAKTGRDEIGSAREKFKQRKPEEIQRMLTQGLFFGSDRTAAVLELAQRQKLAPISGITGYDAIRVAEMQRAKRELILSGGDYKDIVRADPSIAELDDLKLDDTKKRDLLTKINSIPFWSGHSDKAKEKIAAELYVMENWITPADVLKFDSKFFSSADQAHPDTPQYTQGNLNKDVFMIGAKGSEHFSRIMREAPEAAEEVNQYVNTREGKATLHEAPKLYEYIRTSPAQQIGWTMPADHEQFIPEATLKKDISNFETRLEKHLKEYNQLLLRGAPPSSLNRAIDRLVRAISDWTESTDRLGTTERDRQRTNFESRLLPLRLRLPPNVNIPGVQPGTTTPQANPPAPPTPPGGTGPAANP